MSWFFFSCSCVLTHPRVLSADNEALCLRTVEGFSIFFLLLHVLYYHRQKVFIFIDGNSFIRGEMSVNRGWD